MIAHFILAGQSNMDQWFHAGDGAALEAFRETFLSLNPQYSDVQFFDAARGGSAMLSEAALDYASVRAPDDPALFDRISQNYWYDESSQQAGPNLAMFLDDIRSAVSGGTEFLGVIWAQGEADTTYVGAHGSDEYAKGLDYVLDQLMQASEAPQTYIQALGDRAFYSEHLHAGSAGIREAQQAVASASDAITIATTIFDLELRDSVHLTDEAYQTAATRMAIAISSGETSPLAGETLLLDGTTILIQLDLTPDQVITSQVSPDTFDVLDGGADVEIASITITPTGLLQIETATAVSNPSVSYGSAEQSVTMQADDYIYASGPNGVVPVLPFNLSISQSDLSISTTSSGLRIESGTLSEVVHGMSGDDLIYGNDGHDTLIGANGRDRLYGGNGSDTFVVGTDFQTDIVYDFSVAEDAIGLLGYTQAEVNMQSYGDSDLDIRTSDGQRIVLRNVSLEDAANIRFHTLGTDGDNALIGSSEDNRIFAYSGDDVVNSGAGYDRIWLGEGYDTVSFGTGFNTNIIYDFNIDEDTISLVDTLATSLSFSQYQGTDLDIRTVYGDRLVLRNVSLTEYEQINFVDDRPEVAFIEGTASNDVLRGSNISDFIDSSGGTDRLYGGGGDDVFVFEQGSDLNVVYDFSDGQDRILIVGGNFDDLTVSTYNTTDTQIRLPSGDRFVIRNLDQSDLSVDDFVFAIPTEFL